MVRTDKRRPAGPALKFLPNVFSLLFATLEHGTGIGTPVIPYFPPPQTDKSDIQTDKSSNQPQLFNIFSTT